MTTVHFVQRSASCQKPGCPCINDNLIVAVALLQQLRLRDKPLIATLCAKSDCLALKKCLGKWQKMQLALARGSRWADRIACAAAGLAHIHMRVHVSNRYRPHQYHDNIVSSKMRLTTAPKVAQTHTTKQQQQQQQQQQQRRTAVQTFVQSSVCEQRHTSHEEPQVLRVSKALSFINMRLRQTSALRKLYVLC